MKILRAYLAVPLVRNGVWLTLIAFALIILVERLFWQPVRVAHSQLRSQVIALQAEKTNLQTRIDATDNYKQSITALETVNARLAAPIDRSGVVEIFAEISAVAGTQIIHGANTFGQPRGSIRPVMQDLTVEGTYAQIMQFLGAATEVETMTLLRRAEFSTNADGTTIRLQLKLMTLSQGETG